MAKKKIVLPVLALVFLVIAGYAFWYTQIRLTPPDEWNKAKISKPTDFTVTETSDQKIIENKSAGLTFAVPKDWIATSAPSMFEITSPGAKERNSIVMDSGCRIFIEVEKINTNVETLKIEQRTGVWGQHIVQQDEIMVNNKSAESFIAVSEKLNFYNSGVRIPYHRKVYSMLLITTPQDSDVCLQIFQNILKNVKIQ